MGGLLAAAPPPQLLRGRCCCGEIKKLCEIRPPLLSLPLCLLPESVLETRVALVVPKLVLVAGVTQDRTHLTSTRASTGHAAGTIPTLLTIALLVFGWTLHMRWSLGPVHNRQCNVWHTPSRECDGKQCYNDNPASNAP